MDKALKLGMGLVIPRPSHPKMEIAGRIMGIILANGELTMAISARQMVIGGFTSFLWGPAGLLIVL